MGKFLSGTEVYKQSKHVFGQFGHSKWIPNAKINASTPFKDSNELFQCGVGKVLLCIGMGASLEENIDLIRENRNRFDIAACDKAFGPLLDHGVKSDFVLCCDANIPFHYLEKWVDQTEGVKLLATPYANPEWTKAWKGPRYHFVMRDAIESELNFYGIMGKIRDIPAGSNVSNAILTFFLGCDEWNSKNWGCYERYFLVGYDYSWQPEGNYYAWANPIPKRHYMNHRTLLDIKGNICFTSENLFFSQKWLRSYLHNFNQAPVVNCSNRGLLEIRKLSTLEQSLKTMNPDPKITERIKQAFESLKVANKTLKECAQMYQMTREEFLWQ